MKFRFIILFFLSLTLVQKSLANTSQVLTTDLEFSCAQHDENSIDCAYRLIKPDYTQKISASLNTLELPISDINTYPYTESQTSILFLIDTSTENIKDGALPQISEHVTALAQQALPHHQLGLVTFDNRLNILNPLGATPEDIIDNIANISKTEKATELNRNLLDAIQLLKASHSERKAIYLFSDGQANDQDVYQQDVIQQSKASDIKIISIAYPTSDALDDIGLQNLKKLSIKTGGIFIQPSDENLEQTEDFLVDPFAAIDNGGKLKIDLSPAVKKSLSGRQIAILNIETSSKRITVKLPLRFHQEVTKTREQPDDKTDLLQVINNSNAEEINNDKMPVIDETTPLKTEASLNEEITPEKKIPQSTSGIDSRIIGALFVLSLLALLALILIRRKNNSDKQMIKKPAEIPYYLIPKKSPSSSHLIDSSPWKIGRTRQNNLFLDHSSVSRKHAEVRKNKDGTYTISDLDSLNGVFVNNTKVRTGLLKEGDSVDVGDVRFNFTQNNPSVES